MFETKEIGPVLNYCAQRHIAYCLDHVNEHRETRGEEPNWRMKRTLPCAQHKFMPDIRAFIWCMCARWSVLRHDWLLNLKIYIFFLSIGCDPYCSLFLDGKLPCVPRRIVFHPGSSSSSHRNDYCCHAAFAAAATHMYLAHDPDRQLAILSGDEDEAATSLKMSICRPSKSLLSPLLLQSPPCRQRQQLQQ